MRHVAWHISYWLYICDMLVPAAMLPTHDHSKMMPVHKSSPFQSALFDNESVIIATLCPIF